MNDRVMNVWVDEHGLLHTSFHGEILGEKTLQLQKDIADAQHVILDAFEKNGHKKCLSIVDLSHVSDNFETNTLGMLSSYMNWTKPYVEKNAAFGANRPLTLVGHVVSAMSGREDISFFATQEEASAWLLKV